MYHEQLRQAWVETDLGALQHNLKEIRKQLNGQGIVAVVKADAYGHGAIEVARTLESCGVELFAVATLEEALELRHNGINHNILILGFVPSECYEVVIANNLTPVIGRTASARALSEAALRLGRKDYNYMFTIDTGMGRIGYSTLTEAGREHALKNFLEMNSFPGIKAVGMMTHFSTADEEDREYTEMQIRCYEEFYKMLKAQGISLIKIAANSAAIMVHHKALYNMVRPGIILYGLYPSNYLMNKVLDLKPVMSVKANVVNVKTIAAGTSVSYGRKFTSDRESVIATIPIGYADGYSRALSGQVEVLVGGKRCPVVGNICMDQCMIDVSDIPDVKIGTEVVIMGQQGDEQITADEFATKLGTINYEIVCRFGLRLPKVFIGGNE